MGRAGRNRNSYPVIMTRARPSLFFFQHFTYFYSIQFKEATCSKKMFFHIFKSKNDRMQAFIYHLYLRKMKSNCFYCFINNNCMMVVISTVQSFQKIKHIFSTYHFKVWSRNDRIQNNQMFIYLLCVRKMKIYWFCITF